MIAPTLRFFREALKRETRSEKSENAQGRPAMLFNSYAFIFIFLPLVLAAFYGLRAGGFARAALGALIAASLYFYGAWQLWQVPVLLASVALNYAAARALRYAEAEAARAKTLLAAALLFNVALLGAFKYAPFFAPPLGFSAEDNPTLPLGISFYTFQQIAFLVDVHRRKVKNVSFRNYLLFVSFFPQLVAGPIVHYRQMLPQFLRTARSDIPLKMLGLGLVFFCIGLFKKTVLADHFATIADPAFGLAASGGSLAGAQAWQGLLAYSFQIYFDFSGYAEMAIGLGLLFGVRLPVNFYSPYKAANLVEFWRHWHITLSHFLRDYVYIPLGGNRKGKPRQAANLFVTMLLAGIWHGAGWAFIAWGGLHGILLTLNHFFGTLRPPRKSAPSPVVRAGKTALTFLVVTLLWVLFRSADMGTARAYYAALARVSLPDTVSLGSWNALWPHAEPSAWLWLAAGFTIVWALPNTIRWLAYEHDAVLRRRFALTWRHGFVAGALLLISLKTMSLEPSRAFVYFVF
jgi:alginate O-acetyltransferase complex protein AlgI